MKQAKYAILKKSCWLHNMERLSSFSGTSNIISFNFSSNCLKIAVVKASLEKPEIISFSNHSIEGLTELDTAKLIKESIKEHRSRKPVFISTIDSEFIITKNIEIPSVIEKEIKEIIDLQAGRYTPYAKEEIIIDYINIGTYHNSYTKVLLVILKKEIVKNQIALFEKAGINLAKVQISAESVGYSCPKLSGLSEATGTNIIINIDARNTDFIVVFKAKVIFIRSIPIGYINLSAAQQEQDNRFIEEIKKTIEAYRSEDIEAMPAQALIMGARDRTQAFKASFKSILNIPVNILSLEDKAVFSKQALNELNNIGEASFVNAVLAALAFNHTRVDLRPSELKLRLAFEEKSREIIKTGVWVMALIVVSCILLLVKIYYKAQYLKKLDLEHSSMHEEVKALEDASSRITLVKNYVDTKKRTLDIISQLYEILPETIYLKSVAVDEKGAVLLKATATAMSEVFGFVTIVENSKYFVDAAASNTINRKEANKDVVDFDMACKVRSKEAVLTKESAGQEAKKKSKEPLK